MMIESIGKKLTEVCTPVIPQFFFSEADVEAYPYAVYDLDVTPFMTKDGIHHYVGDCVIGIYSDDLDNADVISSAIMEAISQGMTGSFSARLLSQKKTCIEGVWIIELNYTLNQYNNGRL